MDKYKNSPNSHEGKECLFISNLLTPIVKAWCTDQSIYITSLGVQVHGGMGFIEDTGAAQYYRDCRILAIYEGTNGIQALDLLRRKLFQENGKTYKKVIALQSLRVAFRADLINFCWSITKCLPLPRNFLESYAVKYYEIN